MARFLYFKNAYDKHSTSLINIDLVLEIVPPTHKGYGCRLIFNLIDPIDEDFMHIDVLETVDEVLNMVNQAQPGK